MHHAREKRHAWPVALPDKTPIKRRWALGAGGGAHALHDGYTDTLYVLLPIWAETFGLSFLQVGFLKTLYSGAMATFQIPVGILAERWGERRLLVLGTVMLGLGYIGFGITGGLIGLVVCLAFAGFGSSVQHPLASSIVSRAFDGGSQRAALGTYNFTGDLGKVIFPAAMAFAIAYAGWEVSSAIFGIFAIAVGGGLYLALRRLDLGARATSEPAEENIDTGDTLGADARGWGIRSRAGFTYLSVIGIIDAVIRAGFLTFLPFLLLAKGADVKLIGVALGLTFAGGAAGKLLCGLAAERFGIIRSVVLTESLTGILLIAIVALPLLGILVLLPAIGLVLNGTSSVLYGTVGDFVNPDRHSRMFGLFYTMIVGSSATAPAIFGLISDASGVEWTIRLAGALAFVTIPFCIALRPIITGMYGASNS